MINNKVLVSTSIGVAVGMALFSVFEKTSFGRQLIG